MKIHLDEHELKSIIQEHLTQQMPDLEKRTFEIEFYAGRGSNGHRAEVEIILASPPAEKPASTEAAAADEEQAVDFKFVTDDSEES